MGDRYVVGFGSGKSAPTIYLYSQWNGILRYVLLEQALKAARDRWNDPDYATRICVSYLVGGEWQKLTGYGLSVNRFCMPDYDTVLLVDWLAGTVSEVSADDTGKTLKGWFLERFVEGDWSESDATA